MSIRIIIIDDHKIVREGLRTLIEQRDGLEVIGEADNARSGLQLIEQLRPDLVIMDISMPDLNGVDGTEIVCRTYPGMKVIGLSMHFDKHFVGRMLMAGASGYLRKACSSDEIVRAIQAVAQGKCVVSDGISNITMKNREEYIAMNHLPHASLLSQREREVVQLIAEGKLTKEIALQMNLSIKTIESHRHHIMEKLELRSHADLVKFAIREGLTSLDE
jgi:two-component system, NarL family, response regulator NreC